eukprot:m.175256 g.175256  ORF g.175256 m.175256 type:complete len:123 (-) comp18349_c0_seq1:102-470(-)
MCKTETDPKQVPLQTTRHSVTSSQSDVITVLQRQQWCLGVTSSLVLFLPVAASDHRAPTLAQLMPSRMNGAEGIGGVGSKGPGSVRRVRGPARSSRGEWVRKVRLEIFAKGVLVVCYSTQTG